MSLLDARTFKNILSLRLKAGARARAHATAVLLRLCKSCLLVLNLFRITYEAKQRPL